MECLRIPLIEAVVRRKEFGMKKMLVLCGMALALFLTTPSLSGDAIRIGYACSNFSDGFQMSIVEAAREYSSKAGVELVVVNAEESLEKQQQQVRQFVQERVDALIVVPVNTDMVQEYVSAAAGGAVPLVFVNRNPYPGQRPPDKCYFIGTDAYVEGETQMNYAGPIIGGDGKLFILQGILTNDATQRRTNGVREVVSASYPELAIVAEASANWRRDSAEEIVTAWIGEFGDKGMDAIISNNDAMALGALDALDKAGVRGVTVMGVDAIPDAIEAIRSGRMTGTVLQDAVLQGKGAVEMAVKAVKGESVNQIEIIPSELVTRETLN